MGIYIFGRRLLEDYLTADENDPASEKDFGKNIIPAMLRDGAALYSYPFEGYWKDVGTLQSLWEANMDLLGTNPVFNIYERDHRIFSRTYAKPPQFVGVSAKVVNSIVTEGCEIYGTVENSVLSGGVYVAPGAVIRDSVIMSDVSVMDGAHIEYAIVDSSSVIGNGAMIGGPVKGEKGKAGKLTVIGADLDVNAGTIVPAGKILGMETAT